MDHCHEDASTTHIYSRRCSTRHGCDSERFSGLVLCRVHVAPAVHAYHRVLPDEPCASVLLLQIRCGALCRRDFRSAWNYMMPSAIFSIEYFCGIFVGWQIKNPANAGLFNYLVEHRGVEPLTSTLRTLRATNCANAPRIRSCILYPDIIVQRRNNCKHKSWYILHRRMGFGN